MKGAVCDLRAMSRSHALHCRGSRVVRMQAMSDMQQPPGREPLQGPWLLTTLIQQVFREIWTGFDRRANTELLMGF